MSLLEKGGLFDGRYRIESLIGSGGMADVYLTMDVETGHPVALKVLKEEFSNDAEFVRRFRSEAEAVMQLSHEGIVQSVGVGEFCECQYIALEYIAGKTLKKVICEDAPMERGRAIRITMRICSALSHAHDQHIVHRDIKPQNIIMEQGDRPIVTDFGIARFVDARTQTYAGDNVLGSVFYVSPEQARGDEVGAQSDIYSLGIVLYEMMTGQLPFTSENTLTVALKHIQDEMVPPIELNASIGIALNDVILKATRKNLNERYASMRDFKRDLYWALRNPDKHIRESKHDTTETRKKKKEQRRTVAIIVAAALCLVIGLVVVSVATANQQNSYVPSLLGKTWLEAEEEAESVGLTLQMGDDVFAAEYASDTIALQSPEPGKRLARGKRITVHLNQNEDMLIMPDFSEQTEAEAIRMADELDVDIEWHYVQDDATEGTIFRQSPQSDTEIERGDTIELWVSGAEQARESMPSVVASTLDEAVQKLTSAGFQNIQVRYVTESDREAKESMVIRQSPIADAMVPETTAIELDIKRGTDYPYTAEIALNVDIGENDSEVLVLQREGSFWVVLDEKIMAQGKQVIPVTIGSDTDGEKEVIVYVNHGIVRTERVKVTPK